LARGRNPEWDYVIRTPHIISIFFLTNSFKKGGLKMETMEKITTQAPSFEELTSEDRAFVDG